MRLDCFSHIKTVADTRKRGAQKAANTQRLRKSQQAHDEQQLASDACYCGVCREQYVEYTDTVQNMLCVTANKPIDSLIILGRTLGPR